MVTIIIKRRKLAARYYTGALFSQGFFVKAMPRFINIVVNAHRFIHKVATIIIGAAEKCIINLLRDILQKTCVIKNLLGDFVCQIRQ